MCKVYNYAIELLYQDITEYYTWQTTEKKWQRRRKGKKIKEGIFRSDSIWRLYTVHPRNTECFHLRLLLVSVKGPVSFKDLKTVNGKNCITFKNACKKINLLVDDEIWDLTL